MDPVCHSGGEGTWGYIAQVLKKTYDGATNINSGTIAVLGANGANNSCGGNWNTLLTTKYLGQFSTAPTVNFYNSTTEVTNFFNNINTLKPKVIWIPDNWARPSGVEDIFTAKAEVIADFVNSGGGLFANMGRFGWLTALLPSATYNNGGCNGGPRATADGATDFNLTDTMVAACWHGYFTGNVGTLKTLAEWRYPNATTSPYQAVSIGGGSVSLPSSFTLAISPTSPRAGEDLIITATAQTLAGVPQSGVTVTVTVSAGPDAGQTFSATTNASGIATITVRTNSTGTATYTATATVNGVAKTVSSTVTWNPPTTTIAAPTTTTTEPAPTTTEPAPTTTEPAPTTTEPAPTTVPPAPTTTEQTTTTAAAITIPETTTSVAIEPVTTTTVHDHSTHDHGPKLPKTGSSAYFSLMIGFSLICIGIVLIQRKRYIG
jgi:LPXTG-motif cell wall-anchored protein